MNRKLQELSVEQYLHIIDTMCSRQPGFWPNKRIATALMLQAVLDLRIDDVLSLKIDSINRSGNVYQFVIYERGIESAVAIPDFAYDFIKEYAKENDIKDNELLFNIKNRAVHQYLKKVADSLGYCGVSSGSFKRLHSSVTDPKSLLIQ